MPDKNCVVDGVETPPVILGDGTFPLGSWMMKPHGDAVLTPEKAYFYFANVKVKRNRENYGSCLCCIAQFMYR